MELDEYYPGVPTKELYSIEHNDAVYIHDVDTFTVAINIMIPFFAKIPNVPNSASNGKSKMVKILLKLDHLERKYFHVYLPFPVLNL